MVRECRNKTQGGPAALIEDKGLLSRKEVQEPNIKRPCKIGILVPVREESSVVVRPILWNPDPGVVELGTWRWIQRERRPKADQDQHQRHHLRSHTRESQQKQEDVTQSDLRECVFKCEVGLRRAQ